MVAVGRSLRFRHHEWKPIDPLDCPTPGSKNTILEILLPRVQGKCLPCPTELSGYCRLQKAARPISVQDRTNHSSQIRDRWGRSKEPLMAPVVVLIWVQHPLPPSPLLCLTGMTSGLVGIAGLPGREGQDAAALMTEVFMLS